VNQKHLIAVFAALALTAGLTACSSSSAPEQSTPPAAAAPAGEAPASAPAAPVERDAAAAPSAATARPANPSGARASSAASAGAAARSAPPPAAPPAPAPPPPPPPPREFTLAEGRAISVYTTATLSTKTNQSGERFTTTLAEPIVDDDWVIAKKGARVEGVIVDSDPGEKVKGVASMTVSLDSLTLADGRTVRLATSHFTTQAKTTKGKDAKKIGIGAGVGAAIGAIAGGGKGAAIGAGVGGAAGTGAVLATRGDPAVIAAETRLRVTLTSPVTITKRSAGSE
jgi:hypothetical protein